MPFNNYTIAVKSPGERILITADAALTRVILSLEISAASQSNVTLTRSTGASGTTSGDYFAQSLIVPLTGSIVLDHKSIIPINHMLKITSDTAGVSAVANVLEQ